MTTVLNIAGHGLKPDGSFDPGAKGLIAKGEHKYMTEDFFPAMKHHIPKGSKLKFEFYTKRNVLHYGDIVSLANSYGKDTIVIEYHYDAFTATAKGGHVIIWHKFKPDSLDLRFRDAIGSMVGLRFEHMGQKGISGRDNLGNARMTANGGVNYRLIELGFGTNKENAKVMTDNIDEYAKKVVEAILDTKVESKPIPKPVAKPVANKPKPASKPKPTKLVEDGAWGKDTTKALQKHYGTPVDGIISGQPRNNNTRYLFSASYGSGGSMLIRAMQRDLGTPVDGVVSYKSTMIRALQRKYGTPVDGYISYPSALIREMQKRLNNGTF